MSNGKCDKCPEYLYQDPNDKTQCMNKECGGNARVTEDALCIPCDPYTRL